MSEYPWDMENMLLAQHEQPCDCAICDEIHFNRETRRQRRKGQLEEVEKLKISLKVAEHQRDDRWIETGLMSEQRRNDLLFAENEKLKAKIKEQDAKCNIYKCMERKDYVLEIERLRAKVKDSCDYVTNAEALVSSYRSALRKIANGSVSGASWQYDYEKCVKIAEAALGI